MTRSIWTKWIIGAALLLLIVAVGSILYYQHTTAADKQAAEQAEKLLQEWEAGKAKTPTTVDKEVTQAPAESTTPTAEKQKTIEKPTPSDTNNTAPDGIQNDKTNKPSVDEMNPVRMSPHGFGPYPRVPKDYFLTCGPTPWQMIDLYGLAPPSREIELIYRVMVKLWQEGDTKIQGGTFENGKVYVNYSDRVYVRYSTITNSDGTTSRYISSWSSHADVPAPTQAEAFAGHNPEGLEVIDLDVEDPGIDPYSFLGLEK